MLIRNAEIFEGATADVRLESGIVAEIATGIDAAPDERVVDASGNALIPGLHDHHIHLYALAAARRSVACGPGEVRDASALAEVLGRAEPRPGAFGWIRGVGYHESVAGDLDRAVLDRWVSEHCLRIQHRSGQAWFLNSPAIEYLGLDDGLGPEGVERDATGRATGRLLRCDQWLAEQLPSTRPDLGEVGQALASFGVTGATDAGPANDASDIEALAGAIDSGALRQRLFVMGSHELPVSMHPDVTSAALKIILDESRLPGIESVVCDIERARDNGRSVAFHCVTRAELILAIGALEQAGPSQGDRIEHGGVIAPESLESIARMGLSVVTQPGFIRERGDRYLVDVAPEDLPYLYRCKSLDDASIALAGSTDAPYSNPDPWLAMQTAVDRRTLAGVTVGSSERVTPERALRLFTTPPHSPGGPARRVEIGAAADICLLAGPWSVMRDRLSSDDVRATWLGGELTYERDQGPL